MITAQTNADLEAIAKRLLEAESVVISGHVSPDGDCIGSQLALCLALRAAGKKADCIYDTDSVIDSGLFFLPGFDSLMPAASYGENPEVFLSVDVPTVERLGADAAAVKDRSAFSITVDHHAVDMPMSDMTYVDPDVAATSMLAWDLAELLGASPGSEIATCCYTGLVTDTGCFQFQNTDAAAFNAAYQMVMAGADPAFIAQEVFQNRSMASLKLEGIAVSRLECLSEGAIALSYLTADDFATLHATKADAEPVINTLRSLAGVRVACVLREQEHNVRGSLRAKDATDVSALARSLGGGGHKAAAGFTYTGSLEDALKTVRRCLKAAVEHTVLPANDLVSDRL